MARQRPETKLYQGVYVTVTVESPSPSRPSHYFPVFGYEELQTPGDSLACDECTK